MAKMIVTNLIRIIIDKIYLKSPSNLLDLWALASGGNHKAFALLHENLYGCLYNYVLHIVKEEEITDDLLQDVFVKIWNMRAQIGPINNVKAYFFTAARSVAINHFRKIKRQYSSLEKFPEPDMIFSQEDILIASESRNELKQLIALALDALPCRQREIIYLRFYEEMDYKKIAEITGIKYQSVINHVFRALQALRSEYRQLEPAEILT